MKIVFTIILFVAAFADANSLGRGWCQSGKITLLFHSDKKAGSTILLETLKAEAIGHGLLKPEVEIDIKKAFRTSHPSL